MCCRVIDESGLSFVQMKALVTLGGTEIADEAEGTTVTALAESLGISAASASRAVEGLVKRRLTSRVEDTEDRRIRRLTLTAKGRELADQIVSARLAGIEDFTASLESRERSKLAAALGALMERPELAEVYRRNQERAAPMTRYRHLITDDNRKWWTLGAMCFALFMVMLDNTVVNVALPSIQRDLKSDISDLEWVVNGYTLTFAVLIATGGRLGDIFGRRAMFLTGVIIFALTSATAGLAVDSTMLIVSRAVQGIGAALMMPATLSIVTHAFPASERGKAIGTWAGVSALALSIGPVVGGALTEYVSWRAIFFINLPVAVAAVIATLFAVRESRDDSVDRTVDYPGIVALTAGLTAIVLALIEGNAWGWGSTEIVALLVGGAAALAAFVAIELRSRAPMVEFALFRSRQSVGANLVAFIITFAMMGSFFFMALYLQDILGYGALEAGIRFLPTTLVIAVVAPVAGQARGPPRPGLADERGAHRAQRLDVHVLDDRHRNHLQRPAGALRPDGRRVSRW